MSPLFLQALSLWGSFWITEKAERKWDSLILYISIKPTVGRWMCLCSCASKNLQMCTRMQCISVHCLCAMRVIMSVYVHAWVCKCECLWFTNHLMEYCSQRGFKLIWMIKTQSTPAFFSPWSIASFCTTEKTTWLLLLHTHYSTHTQTGWSQVLWALYIIQ